MSDEPRSISEAGSGAGVATERSIVRFALHGTLVLHPTRLTAYSSVTEKGPAPVFAVVVNGPPVCGFALVRSALSNTPAVENNPFAGSRKVDSVTE
jgi:hypothetical protein